MGQFTAVANLAMILGSFLFFWDLNSLNITFQMSYAVAFLGFLTVAVFLYRMQKDKPYAARTKFQLRKEYRLFYWLNILYGTRKQIFLTFAPWVLVTVFRQKTQMLATLLMLGGIIGIFFKPMLGRAIDKLGETIHPHVGSGIPCIRLYRLWVFRGDVFRDRGLDGHFRLFHR